MDPYIGPDGQLYDPMTATTAEDPGVIAEGWAILTPGDEGYDQAYSIATDPANPRSPGGVYRDNA